MLNKEVDARGNFGFFEKGLAEGGVVDKLVGNGIGDDEGVVDAVEEFLDLLGDVFGEVRKNC